MIQILPYIAFVILVIAGTVAYYAWRESREYKKKVKAFNKYESDFFKR